MIQLGPYRLDLINDGFFELSPSDFVQVGKPAKPEVEYAGIIRRIQVGFNTLLIRGRGHTALIDPGSGDKPRPDKVDQYKMEWPRKFFSSLTELGVRCEDVDTVILTHLHWDHCGAATRSDADGQIVPSFPNAQYFVQEREFVHAQKDAAINSDSYLVEDFVPLEKAGKLELVNGTQEILPGITLRWTGGHCPGHQIVIINSPDEHQAVYLSDLIPTSAQIPLNQAMSYDDNSVELLMAKRRILSESADNHALLMFVHAPRVVAGFVQHNPDGKFVFRKIDFNSF
jgi:glyoxylase-like metal-dependent hydrolase (beta-lactamase superfamily II)